MRAGLISSQVLSAEESLRIRNVQLHRSVTASGRSRCTGNRQAPWSTARPRLPYFLPPGHPSYIPLSVFVWYGGTDPRSSLYCSSLKIVSFVLIICSPGLLATWLETSKDKAHGNSFEISTYVLIREAFIFDSWRHVGAITRSGNPLSADVE